MNEVLAALDCSLAAKPVLATAQAVGEVLGAAVAGIHVGADAEPTPRGLAEAAGVPLRVVQGPVVDRLIAAGEDEATSVLVIGARGIPTDPRPLGATAVSVATSVLKPVVVVAPDAHPPATIRRILVPLEGDLSSSVAPRVLLEPAPHAELDLVALHVFGPDEIPAFDDQPYYEQEARAQEFLARYCPWGPARVRLATRVGRREEEVARAAAEFACDMIVLGWSQRFTAGRARVVRGTLERCTTPVMLFPVGRQPGTRPSFVNHASGSGPRSCQRTRPDGRNAPVQVGSHTRRWS